MASIDRVIGSAVMIPFLASSGEPLDVGLYDLSEVESQVALDEFLHLWNRAALTGDLVQSGSLVSQTMQPLDVQFQEPEMEITGT